MTKEEKIEKVCKTMNKIYPNIEVMAEKIIDVLEEPEERFLDYEIVGVWGARYYAEYQDVEGREPTADILKLTPEVLAATVGARIPGAKWAAVDKDSTMYFYTDEPVRSSTYNCWFGPECKDTISNPYCIPCPVDGWAIAKWRLE